MADMPFRCRVWCSYASDSAAGKNLTLCVLVKRGVLNHGMELKIAPFGLMCGTYSLVKDGENISEALPHDDNVVHIDLDGFPGFIEEGCMVSDLRNDPARTAKSFTAVLYVHSPERIIRKGDVLKLKLVDQGYGGGGSVRVEHLLSKYNRQTGEEVVESPSSLKEGDLGTVRMIPHNNVMVVEALSEYRPLGRFSLSLMDEDQKVAVGFVKEVEKFELETEFTTVKHQRGTKEEKEWQYVIHRY